MNRTNSMANSVTSATSSTLYSSNNYFPLSPLIKLERLVYRSNSIISINLDSFNEFELKNHLKLLLEYQKEISKLKEIIDENHSKIKLEFEFENRIQWIENRIELLNKIIKELQEKMELKVVNEEDIVVVSDEVVVDQVVVDENSLTSENFNNDLLPRNNQSLINEILPPKPETLLSLPIPSKSPSETQSKDHLIFSSEIQSEHDNLTNDLIATVQLIKRNNLDIQKMVKSDDKIITEATGLLATNSDSMQKEGKNLKSYSKTAWVSFWKMLGILFFVCFTFIFVYIFIRLT